MPGRSARTAKLDLRLSPEAKKKLQTATASAGRTVSEFVLEGALLCAPTKLWPTGPGSPSMPTAGRLLWRRSTHRLAKSPASAAC